MALTPLHSPTLWGVQPFHWMSAHRRCRLPNQNRRPWKTQRRHLPRRRHPKSKRPRRSPSRSAPRAGRCRALSNLRRPRRRLRLLRHRRLPFQRQPRRTNPIIVIPAKAGIQALKARCRSWIPAFAGMTGWA
jgi:hypothetical protein